MAEAFPTSRPCNCASVSRRNAFSAARYDARPASVGSTRRLERPNDAMPIQCSSHRMRRPRAGCIACRCPAASEHLPQAARSRKPSIPNRSMRTLHQWAPGRHWTPPHRNPGSGQRNGVSMIVSNNRDANAAVLPGDGSGREVWPPALNVLKPAGKRRGVNWTEHDWSRDRHRKTGAMMPGDAVAQVRPQDAILLGAVGAPGLPDHVSRRGMLIPLRCQPRQYACIRPTRQQRGSASCQPVWKRRRPLKSPGRRYRLQPIASRNEQPGRSASSSRRTVTQTAGSPIQPMPG